MPQASLSSCWAKIERAREHREVLEAYIATTFAVEGNRPRQGLKFDAESGHHILYVNAMPELGSFLERVAIMVGDVIHNLRCALDHLVFQLAILNTEGHVQRPWVVQFVIEDSPEDFAKVKWRLAEVSDDNRNMIEHFQPYRGRSGRPDRWSGPYVHQLALLKHLSNTDKHRFLSPVLALPWQTRFSRTSAFMAGFPHDRIGELKRMDPHDL